jgi:L-alanine-DL-glutamate epimerase-like enolase superfamily enzyme
MDDMSLKLFRLKVPLKQPYNLSFGRLDHFDTIIMKAASEERSVYSETTSLYGYSWERSDQMWETARSMASSAGGSLSTLMNTAMGKQASIPFTSSLVLVAIEKLLAEDDRIGPIAIPLVGIISDDDPETAGSQAEEQLGEGFRVIKVKIKGLPATDIEKIHAVQSVLGKRAAIRIDANQAYSLDNIGPFIEKLDPTGIELLEQPFRMQEWQDMSELAKISPVPLMLDESIWTESDIEKTHRLKCARHVKLKLFKHSSLEKTLQLIRHAKGLGLGVVFGNGVQTELGCLDEARIYMRSGLDSVAEFNGFIKQKVSIFNNPPVLKDGMMLVGEAPEPIESAIEDMCTDAFEVKLTNDLKHGDPLCPK